MKAIAWDLVFYFIIIFLGILSLIVLVTGVFPNIVAFNKDTTCRAKIANYCSAVVCGKTAGFDLKGCEDYTYGITKPTSEECERLGFKCE